MDIRREASPVIGHADHIAGLDLDLDVAAEPSQGLVYGVVHHLVHQVVESRLAGRADVHCGPYPDRLQPLEHPYGFGAVLSEWLLLVLRTCVAHACAG